MLKILLYVALIPFKIIEIFIRTFIILLKPSKKYNNSFNREANLWGLSNEDKRIARQERMSPADYTEAEENDDDDLDYDD